MQTHSPSADRMARDRSCLKILIPFKGLDQAWIESDVVQ